MFPKISDLFNYLFGSHWDFPVQTYGFFLAMAFFTAGIVLKAELKRKEKEGLLPAQKRFYSSPRQISWIEIISSTVISAIIGWKLFGIILNYSDFSVNPQEFLLSANGSRAAFFIIMFVSLAFYFSKRFLFKRNEVENQEKTIHPYQYTWNILIVGLIFALLGSKLFDLMDNFNSFIQNPLRSILSFSGLTFYGGFIVTVIALLLYMRIIHLDWKHVIDSSAPAIMIGYAVGRLGCHFSGDGCWGIINTSVQPGWLSWMPGWLWAFDYPHNVINQGVKIANCYSDNCRVLELPVFPTSLYESALAFIFTGLLWIMRRKLKAPVTLFGLFLILTGISRFMIEKIRVNNKYGLLGYRFTQAELISVILVGCGIFILIYFSGKHKQENQHHEL